MKCLQKNKIESDKQTFYDTIKIIEIMDKLRGKDLIYPCELN